MFNLFAQATEIIPVVTDAATEVAEGSLTLSFVIGGALADSINPCVFGVLIFLLAFMTRVFKQRKQMLLAGLWYTLVVYLTYLALGFGILHVAVSADISQAFYWVAAIIAIVAGLLELKDFFWYGKGFTLQMLPGAAERVKTYTGKVGKVYKKKPFWAYTMLALLGVFVVLVELPCTGAPYFAVLALLAEQGTAAALPYLLLYNLIFILPLFVIIGFAYFGKGGGMEAWRKKHRGAMRGGTGIFLLILGGYMIYTIMTT